MTPMRTARTTASAASHPATSLRPWQPRPGEWRAADAAHLLDRAGFGPEPGEAQRLADGTLDDALTALFEPPGHDPFYFEGIELLLGSGELEPLAAWWIGLMVAGGDPLGERIALMWHDHFATSNDKVADPRLMHRQNELFRKHGLGDFRALCHHVAKDPAMLVWLDGNENVRGRPNENFAREVMELFVLGIGSYTETDIREAARAFSGWGTRGRSFRFDPRKHDDGDKTVFGRTARFTPEGMLDWILAQPEAPRHIARRVLATFVTSNPKPELVDDAAARLVAHDWNVGALVRDVLRSEAFFDAASRNERIAGPVELVARATRRLGFDLAPRDLARATADMGQALFRPPSVKGWDGGEVWLNAGTWTARHNALLQGLTTLDDDGYHAAFARPESIEHAADLVLDGLLPGREPPGLREALLAELDGQPDPTSALRLATGLVLVDPAYHLV